MKLSKADKKVLANVPAEMYARIEELEAQNAELLEALNRICANPAVQDTIEANPQTTYLIHNARSVIAKYSK